MTIDLKAYLERLEYRGELAPTLETLKRLHFAHATHIPFENLEILLGRPIKLDRESLWTKMVTGRRGGYCFEQNALFATVLEELGFRVTRLAARVRLGVKEIRPRSHMLLAVEIEGNRWLADVGFGGEGLLHPLAAGGGGVPQLRVGASSNRGGRGSCPADTAPRWLVRPLCVHSRRAASRRLRGRQLLYLHQSPLTVRTHDFRVATGNRRPLGPDESPVNRAKTGRQH